MSTGMATNVHHSNPNFLYPTNNRSQQTQLCLSDGILFFPPQISTFLRIKLKIGGEARARLASTITEQLADSEALAGLLLQDLIDRYLLYEASITLLDKPQYFLLLLDFE